MTTATSGDLRVTDLRPAAIQAGRPNLLEVRVIAPRGAEPRLVGAVADQVSFVERWGRDHVEYVIYGAVHGTDVAVDHGSSHVALVLRHRATPSPAEALPDATVHLAMAVYNPPAELFRQQIDSIRGQSFTDWHCLVVDDSTDGGPVIDDTIAGDPRFTVRRNARRLGFYRNFERAIAEASAGCRFVALSDQDDRWHPNKLERLLATVGPAAMAVAPVISVDETGRRTAHQLPPPNIDDPWRAATANTLVGMSMLVTPRLIDVALPFPDLPGRYHDKWLALCAMATDGIALADEPLTDYVQHGDNALGAGTASRRGAWHAVRRIRDLVDAHRVRLCAVQEFRAPDLGELMLASVRGRPGSPVARSYADWRERSIVSVITRTVLPAMVTADDDARDAMLSIALLRLEQRYARPRHRELAL